MIKCAKNIESHYETYHPTLQNGKIGYKKFDTINFLTNHSYYTHFCYYYEYQKDNSKVSEEQFKEYSSSIILGLGSFSYAQVPLDMKFQNIFGVTGTLLDQNPKVFQYFQDYNINQLNFATSIYPEKNDIFKKKRGFQVYSDKLQWYSNIHASSIDAQNEGQPTIIFFENVEKLEGYKNYLEQESKYDSNYYQIFVTESGENYKQIIKKSTQKKYITLADQIFGRGVDYKCYNKSINENGGLQIIITFLSKQKVDELQMIGRTARKGYNGEAKIYLLQDQLISVYKIKKDQIDNWRKDDTLYDNLDTIRQKSINGQLDYQRDKVNYLKPNYVNSKKLQYALYNNEEQVLLEQLEHFNL